MEAIERSRASQADIGRSLMAERDEDDSSFGDGDSNDDGDNGAGFAADDFGGGGDDDEDDYFKDSLAHGDAFQTSFIHDGDHRFSSESFQTTFQTKLPPCQATILLDAIASGNISGSQSNYEYFNQKALESIQGNNQWAGSAHWKKLQPKRNVAAKLAASEEAETVIAAKKKRSKNKASASASDGRVLIDIAKTSVDLKGLLKQPPKAKKGATHPLQMTKAAISKATKNENLLPRDAGINVQNLTSLFSRPNTNVMDLVASATPAVPLRHVGFGGIETWGNDDNSYGDDDQGAGFAFGSGGDDDNDDESRHRTNDYRIPELEGIRKVEKVRVAYATVAKQVDVKRLKSELWLELERTFQERNMKMNAGQHKDQHDQDDDDDSMDSIVQEAEQSEKLDASPTQDSSTSLSFQQTIREMQESQSQSDVTLPFYFICILHLANEKGLALESTGLEDFIIHSC
jgi:condensin complex subunit 2